MPDLTPEGKKAVQDTWAPVAANPKHFGVLLFIKYFTEYPRTQDFFEHFKGKSLEELKTSAKLRAHGTTVLHAVTAMVENLDDLDTMVVLLNNTVDRHTPRTVGFPEYDDLFKCIGSFLAEQLGDKFDEVAKQAWGIVLDTMGTVIKAQLSKQ
ncbi:hypothetical protein NP493_383g00037 [Ridgeia piscesae]|uniref:Globin domain-containing protein n=1 Tax=Ridgeia piscesae TaxID=27915 RepID=A0AAD9L2B5_RIDPI|nr:hypothetical protein NP493_383g00037 [Ridgeia piscesae]